MTQLLNVSVRLTSAEMATLRFLQERYQKNEGERVVSLGETARRAILAEAKRIRRAKQ